MLSGQSECFPPSNFLSWQSQNNQTESKPAAPPAKYTKLGPEAQSLQKQQNPRGLCKAYVNVILTFSHDGKNSLTILFFPFVFYKNKLRSDRAAVVCILRR